MLEHEIVAMHCKDAARLQEKEAMHCQDAEETEAWLQENKAMHHEKEALLHERAELLRVVGERGPEQENSN